MPADFESGVFTEGKTAWHGLGVTLPSDALNSQEALEYSGLAGWELAKVPLFEGNPEDGYKQIPELWYGVKRTGTDGKILGVVGPWYDILPNEEAFAWMDELLGGEGFHIKTAGSLRGGSTVWVLAKAPFSIDLPDSPIDQYVLISNTHDGSSCIKASVTPVRVVCSNTLRAALREAAATVNIRHTKGKDEQLQEAQRLLGLAKGAQERVKARVEALAGKKISGADWTAFLEKLVPLEAQAPKATETRVGKHREALTTIYEGEHYGQKEIHGTAYGAWMAVVAHHDHMGPSRKTEISTPEELRFERILGGANVTDKALALLS